MQPVDSRRLQTGVNDRSGQGCTDIVVTEMNVSTASTHCIEGPAAAWYLVQCKPRQDERAEENLLRQGYACYRPQHSCERIVRGRRQPIVESLFPGYLFIQLAADGNCNNARQQTLNSFCRPATAYALPQAASPSWTRSSWRWMANSG
ncbi:Transcription antitermination protein RfaH [compost metagenome]